MNAEFTTSLSNEIFNSGPDLYNPQRIFFAFFQEIPNIFHFEEIDLDAFENNFEKHQNDRILKKIYNRTFGGEKERNQHNYILRGQIVLIVDSEKVILLSQDCSTKQVNDLVTLINSFKREGTNDTKIHLIVSQPGCFESRSLKFEKQDLQINKLYNDGIRTFHKKITHILQKKNHSGLHLLYGIPGTGKSTYIRYLIGHISKKVIFLPGQMAENLDNVFMVRFLMRNPNSLLIIEDAEGLIVSRDNGRNSNLSMILNLTDGILGESLGIQIIATFNTDLKKIDPALLRKGRLKTSYEFTKLSVEKTNRLLKSEGVAEDINRKLTLAEIFNFKADNDFKRFLQPSIGFKS